MNKILTFLTATAVLIFCVEAIAAEKSRADLQSDLATYKLRDFNATTNFDRLTDFSDSHVNTTTDVQAAFDTALTGNPFMKATQATITAASANSGLAVLAATSGKTVTVHGFSMFASGGNAGGATDILIECTGGNDLVQIPVADLTQNDPVAPGDDDVVLSSAYVNGCPSGEGVQVIASGTLTGASHLIGNLQYTFQ